MAIPAINIHDHRNGTRAGGAVMAWPIWISSKGGRIGRFHWINSDQHQTCSSCTLWGDWWWGDW